jgi:transposase InsO family protein
MRLNNLYARHRKRYRITTNSKHNLPIAPNLLNRDFTAPAPNKRWVSDITYIPTRSGWLYLVVIIDLFSRKVVGWATSKRLKHRFVVEAVRNAVHNRQPLEGLILHSDRGVQYASKKYQDLLRENKMLCSMSRKGNCWDNAPAESFFSTLKQELMGKCIFATREEANLAIFEYIEVYYNRKRKHSTNNYMSPEIYEKTSKCA